MKSFLKVSCSVLLVFILIISMAACSGGATNGGTSSTTSNTANTVKDTTTAGTTAKKPVTISLATFNAWQTDGFKAGIQKAEELTGNKVDLQIFPDDQFVNVIKAKLATGDTPDLIAIWPDVKGSPLPSDQFETLDGPWVNTISSQQAYYQSTDGRQIAAPYGACNNLGVIYNKEIFNKAGIAVPLKTFSGLVAACEAIKKIGVTPISLAYKDGWPLGIYEMVGMNWVFQKDPTIAEQIEANKIKISQVPGIVESLKRLNSLKEKGYFNADFLSTTVPMTEKALAEGTAAMCTGGDWLYNDFAKDYPDKLSNIGMIPVTLGDDYIDVAQGPSGNGLWLPKAAKNKDAAREFINTFVSDEVMKVIYEKSPGIAPYKDLDVPMSAWNTEMVGYLKQFPIGDDFRHVYLPGFNLDDSTNHLQQILAGRDVMKSLDDWYDSYAKINKAKGTPGF